ncbi:unnamed protein product [Musa acuminata subsp. burmannicoides]
MCVCVLRITSCSIWRREREGAKRRIHVFVRTLTRKTIALEVESRDTVDEVRSKIQAGQGRHFLGLTEIDFCREPAGIWLKHLRITILKKESTFHLIPRLRFGMITKAKTLTGKEIENGH